MPKRNYYVEGGRWFVVRTTDKTRARQVGVREFGRGGVHFVREAKPHETESYVSQRSLEALYDDDV